jgi:hypothetical protein
MRPTSPAERHAADDEILADRDVLVARNATKNGGEGHIGGR